MNLIYFLTENIDSYCERTDSSFLSEPLNLYSNICFIISAALLHGRTIKMRRSPAINPYGIVDYTLILLMYIIGLGSGLFHSFANRGTMFLDVAPISLYIFIYLTYWLKFLMGFSPHVTYLWLAFWLSITAGFTIFLKELPLGGSQTYLSVAVFLTGMAIYQKLKDGSFYLAIASICFLISLTFRSIDPYFCPLWPHGTHFLWHVLNSVVLYFATLNALTMKEDRAYSSKNSP